MAVVNRSNFKSQINHVEKKEHIVCIRAWAMIHDSSVVSFSIIVWWFEFWLTKAAQRSVAYQYNASSTMHQLTKSGAWHLSYAMSSRVTFNSLTAFVAGITRIKFASFSTSMYSQLSCEMSC